MYPMDLLVDYIYRGVGTFSGPFHPFGGAVDIVVVQQPDGTFKSSPWYVRFGKFQGVLKSKEKIVNISINGNEASFHMHLDSTGEAFFLHTAELDEKEEKICEGEKKNGKINEGQIVKKTVSNRPSIFGFMFGRSSIKIKPDGLEDISSLQRAEFAAELLDNNWSTNLSLRDWREGQSSSSNLEGQDENSFVNDNTANEEVHSRGDESDSANLGGQIENLVNDGSENTTTRSEPDLEKALEESIGSNQIKDVISFPENLEDLQFNSSDGERETETENKTHEKEESIESDENEETDNHNGSTDIETRYESSPICIPSTSSSSTININLNMAISLPIIQYDYTSDSESFESITRLSSSLTFNPDFKRENANLSLSLQPGPVFNEPEPIMGEELEVRAEIQSPAGGSSWWRFGFSRSRSKSSYSVVRNLEKIEGVECKNGVKKVRSLTPSSDEIASLGLKEGRNIVTFTFYTPMLGKQQVDARIYLWNYNSRIVISDVDGTITKSDVLGQFMPLVGVDWCHNGVTHLFSAIKDNGYQLLFLSARAISQAHLTRNFLFNLKQDGKALPDGPVVISPDGLFPSLYREVIRRAPHEFKIACLEAIKALFPVDYNPFYAGFGNRDTDELSYLKVGIPIGKIFIINPKGEVAVNRRVDTKSYSSLHELVHGMFPPYSSSEQEVYNDYNYWKVPLPQID